jgi:hypothetical protein
MSTLLADRLDVMVSLVAGIVVTLYGFGALGRRGGPPDQRQARFTKAARWLGPVLVVASAVRLGCT